jgi:hypothetical protein
MVLAPVIFVVGPSGAGKSTVSKWVETDLQFLHLEIDRNQGLKAYGMREEYHQFSSKLNVAPLSACLRMRIAAAKRSGAVLSFPSTRILTPEQIDIANGADICTIILWGDEKFCREARRERERERGRTFDENRYEIANRKSFDTYGRSEYKDQRIVAFQPAGSRWPRDYMTKIIRKRIDG